MEINSSVSERLGVIGGEAWGSLRVFVDNSGLPSCPLLMRMRNGPGNLGGQKGNTCFGSSRSGLQEAGGKGHAIRRATKP